MTFTLSNTDVYKEENEAFMSLVAMVALGTPVIGLLFYNTYFYLEQYLIRKRSVNNPPAIAHDQMLEILQDLTNQVI